MSTYPDAPGHRNVDTSVAAADDLAPKLARLQRMALAMIRGAGSDGRAECLQCWGERTLRAVNVV